MIVGPNELLKHLAPALLEQAMHAKVSSHLGDECGKRTGRIVTVATTARNESKLFRNISARLQIGVLRAVERELRTAHFAAARALAGNVPYVNWTERKTRMA